MAAVRFLAFFFVASIMFSIGLEVALKDIGGVLRERSLLIRSLVANIVLAPVLGLVLARVFSMSADASAGLMLLAFAPGAPFALQFTARERPAMAYAVTLAFLLSALAVFITPLLSLSMALFESRVYRQVPVMPVIGVLFLLQLLPLTIGLIVRMKTPFAPLLARISRASAYLSFAAVVILTLGIKSSAVRSLGAGGLAGVFCLIAGSWVIGWLLGGPDRRNRRVLAMETGFRNVALCLLFAMRAFPETDVDTVVVAFSALVLPLNLIFGFASFDKSSPPKEKHATDTQLTR